MHSVVSDKERLLVNCPKETYETLQPPSNRFSNNSISSHTSIIDENGYFKFKQFLFDIILTFLRFHF